MRKNIVFLGSKKIGYECLYYLITNKEDLNIEVSGVLTNPKRDAGIIELTKKHQIPLISSLNEYLNLQHVDIAISIQYHKILKKKHLQKAKEITINLHMAPLPEYRGSNQFSFAILNKDEFFGTTIHRMEEGADTGAIMFEKRFNIPEGIWVEELFKLTYRYSIDLFKENINKIIEGNYTLTPQREYTNRRTSLHYKNEIQQLKNINLSLDEDEIKRYIRATYMPGFEPPYTKIGDKKMYFIPENEYNKQ